MQTRGELDLVLNYEKSLVNTHMQDISISVRRKAILLIHKENEKK